MRRGDQEALDKLIKYNKEDIINLKTIIELTYPKMVEKALKDLRESIGSPQDFGIN